MPRVTRRPSITPLSSFRARRLHASVTRAVPPAYARSVALQPPVVAIAAVGDVRARLAADAIRDALQLYEPSCHVRFLSVDLPSSTELEADATVVITTGACGHLHPAVNAFLARRAGTDLRGQPVACVSISDARLSAVSWAEGLVRFERSRGATPVLAPLLLVGDPIDQEAGIRRWTMAFVSHFRQSQRVARRPMLHMVCPPAPSA